LWTGIAADRYVAMTAGQTATAGQLAVLEGMLSGFARGGGWPDPTMRSGWPQVINGRVQFRS
jgi:hypothetical protein